MSLSDGTEVPPHDLAPLSPRPYRAALHRATDPVKLRGLTQEELDQLAKYLRKATQALQRYDEAVGDRLGALERIEDPWWIELRAEMLRRGLTPQALDDCVGSCSGTDWYFRHSDEQAPPRWLAPLLLHIVGRIDSAPLLAQISEHIAGLGRTNVTSLVTGLNLVTFFHPFGAPHQVHLTNLAELWGMQPIAETEDGKLLLGYGEAGPPAKGQMPWETGAVKPIVDTLPTDDLPEHFWLPAYEGLLSWIGELCIVVENRLPDIVGAREKIELLQYEVRFLAGLEGAAALPEHAGLVALGEALGVCRRMLLGFYQEIDHPREQLVENLRNVLCCLGATWRQPIPKGLGTLEYDLQPQRGLKTKPDEIEPRILEAVAARSDSSSIRPKTILRYSRVKCERSSRSCGKRSGCGPYRSPCGCRSSALKI